MDRKKLRWLALIALAVVLWWRSCPPGSRDAAAPTGAEELSGVPWLERMPADPRDAIAHLFLIDRDDQRLGAIGRSSAFRINFDLVEWSQTADRLELHLLQEDQRRSFRVRAWSCGKDAPRGFDLCLELTDERGQASRYFSSRAWRDADRLAKDTGLRFQSLRPQL